MAVYATCCRCSIPFILSENGAGVDCDYIGLCGNCRAEVGDINQRIDSLERKIYELDELSKTVREDFNRAVDRQNMAHDNIFGSDGSAVDYLKSLKDLASIGAGETFQKISGYIDNGLSKLNATQGDLKAIAEDIQDLIKNDIGLSTDRIVFKRASAKAKEQYERTGDVREAIENFVKNAKMSRETLTDVGFIDDLYNYQERADRLSNDISDYLLAQKEVNNLHKLLDQINQEAEIAANEIECLRVGANFGDLEKARTNLNELVLTINNATNRVLDSILPMLSPLVFNTWEGLDTKILIELMEKARSELDAIDNDFNKILEYGNNAWTAIERTTPTPTISNSVMQPEPIGNVPEPSSQSITAPSDKGSPEAVSAEHFDRSSEVEQGKATEEEVTAERSNEPVEAEQGKITELSADSGVKLNIASWVPSFDSGGWWGVTRAGESADKRIHWTDSESLLILPPGQYDLYWMPKSGHIPLMLEKGFTVKQGKVTEFNADSGVKLNIASWATKLGSRSWWGVTETGDVLERRINWTGSENALLLPPGQYDLYWVPTSDHIPLMLEKGFMVEKGKVAEFNADSGVKLNIASWVPKFGSSGWWGVTRTGEISQRMIHWADSENALLLPPGQYDLYWVQESGHIRLLLAKGFTVEQGKLAEFNADSGVKLNIASWVPKFGSSGWWGVTETGDVPERRINWTDSENALLLSPGKYDLYWVQESGHIPLSLAKGFTIEQGKLTKFNADSGVKLKLPSSTPPIDPNSGWWGVDLAGGNSESLINWSQGRSDLPLLVPPGTYDIFWKQDSSQKPLRIKEGVSISKGELIEVEAQVQKKVAEELTAEHLNGSFKAEQGKIPEISYNSRVKLNIASWVPEFDSDGWWGVTKTGDVPERRINWTDSEDSLVLPPGQYDLYWMPEYNHIPLMLAKGFMIEQGKVAEFNVDSGVKLNIASWVPKFDSDGWWGVTKTGETPKRRINWTDSQSSLLLPPGQYDLYWMPEYNHIPLMLAKGFTIEQGKVAEFNADSGVKLNIALWVPKFDSDGWWGVTKTGDVPERRINWTDSEDSLVLPPGQYDLYWMPEYNHIRLLLAKGFTVEQGKVTELTADSGVKLNIALWVPEFDSDGWWGVTKTGETPQRRINWTDSQSSLLLPPGQYDLYWMPEYNHIPLMLAKGFTIEQGKVAEFNVDSGVKLNIASWVPEFDSYGWWGVTRTEETPDKRIHWTDSKNSLVLPPGQYDLYWVQEYDSKPMMLFKGFRVEKGNVTELNVDSGIKLKLPSNTSLDSSSSWWGVALAGGNPENRINWSEGRSDLPLLVPPGTYDIFWKQDSSQKPLRVKERVNVNKGELIEVEVQIPKI